tara:strand:+ start:1439 stop:2785 length:1347 start_codon:yes stop_codon:yes gene_type:complete
MSNNLKINAQEQFNQLAESIFNDKKQDEFITISFGGERSHFLRFSQSKIRQNGMVHDASLNISLIYNNRKCSGNIPIKGDLDNDIINARAELSRLRSEVVQLPVDPFAIIPNKIESSNNVNEGQLLSPKDAPQSIMPAMQGIDIAGIWASGFIFSGNANTLGQKHWFSTETFSLDCSLITKDEKMVKATFADSSWDQNKYDKFMNDSIQKLHHMEKQSIKVKPGNYRTYIASAGVSDLLGMLSWNGISESSIQRGQSALCKMKNEDAQLSPCFSLTEDFRTGLVPKFNGLGEISSETLPLIHNGILKNTLISSQTAKEYNLNTNYASTGESIRSPYMSGGELKEIDVLKEIDTGLYLGNLHYLNWSDNVGGRITGMTRYACFWVENGEIVAPIENMRFDDSLYNFFGNNLESVSEDVIFNPETGSYNSRSLGGTYCPGILLSSFSLTL